MKTSTALLLACAPLCAISAAQTTQTYTDATNDLGSGVGVGDFPHINISSVVVTVNEAATDITFRINLQGSPMDSGGSNWGKYLVGIRSAGGGATTGNGWGRPINFAPGMTRWIGTWADAGGETCGGGIFSYGVGWASTGTPSVSKDSGGITITTTVAALGLDPGETFAFDVYTTGGGGGDGAVDALSAAGASITAWGNTYTTQIVGGSPNPALTFTMPGSASFATWITQFGLPLADQDPGDDPDGDTLTNQQEFDADLGMNPSLADTDSDGLNDSIETGTGIYVSPTNSGSLPAISDTDGDSFNDGNEVAGVLTYVSDPNKANYLSMAVPGGFTDPVWASDGSAGNAMSQVGTSLTTQYQWALDYRFQTLGSFEYKFTADPGYANAWPAGFGNYSATVFATGFHTFTFDHSTVTRSFVRKSFADAAEFLSAYGLVAGADEDGDTIDNEDEFTANTDPTSADTDGDGTNDALDSSPLQATRDVVFTVNMNVQEALGNFNPATGSVVVKFFTGLVSGTPDLALTEVGNTGIYTGTLSNLAGGATTNSGGYKFFNTTPGAPNSGYEEGLDRSFDLGAANMTQTLPTVFFSNNSTMPGGYNSWSAANAGGQTADQDFDGDGVDNGVEYFMGQTGSSFTANPQPDAGRVVTWPRDPSASGVSFKILSSADLSTWTDVTGAADVSDPNSVKYTIPASVAPIFVRLAVSNP